MRDGIEKQRIAKDDGRYLIFYSFGAASKRAEKETPSSTRSDDEAAHQPLERKRHS